MPKSFPLPVGSETRSRTAAGRRRVGRSTVAGGTAVRFPGAGPARPGAILSPGGFPLPTVIGRAPPRRSAERARPPSHSVCRPIDPFDPHPLARSRHSPTLAVQPAQATQITRTLRVLLDYSGSMRDRDWTGAAAYRYGWRIARRAGPLMVRYPRLNRRFHPCRNPLCPLGIGVCDSDATLDFGRLWDDWADGPTGHGPQPFMPLAIVARMKSPGQPPEHAART
jgi:hypothetical protein